MADPAPSDLLKVCEAAADAGAALLVTEIEKMRAGKGHRVILKGSVMDPVTAADVAVQERIVAVIQKRFPDHRFLAEEDGADELGNPQSPYVWIIDPIDGTTNFIHGKENVGTIVAVAKDDFVLAGCMILPMMGHRFTAAKGSGAFVDGRPVRLRETSGLSDAILCSNITRRARRDQSGMLQVSVPPCASLENYGCAVHAIGDVLLGWNDGVFFHDLRIWDIAAGFLMIEEAGGRCRFERLEPGNPRSGVRCVGATVPVFNDLCTFVFEQNAA